MNLLKGGFALLVIALSILVFFYISPNKEKSFLSDNLTCLNKPSRLLPDSPFYKFKILRDKLIYRTILDPVMRVEWDLNKSNEMINDGCLLIDKKNISLGKETIMKGENYFTILAIDYQKAVGRRIQIPKDLLDKIILSGYKHQALLTRIEKIVPESEKKTLADVLYFSKINLNTVTVLREAATEQSEEASFSFISSYFKLAVNNPNIFLFSLLILIVSSIVLLILICYKIKKLYLYLSKKFKFLRTIKKTIKRVVIEFGIIVDKVFYSSRMINKQKLEYKQFIVFFSTLLLTLIFTSVILFLIKTFYYPETKNLTILALKISIRSLNLFAPEPLERVLYLTGIIIAPVIAFFSFFLIRKQIENIKNKTFLASSYLLSLVSSLILIILIFYYDFKDSNIFIVKSHLYSHPFEYSLFFGLCLFLILFNMSTLKKHKIPKIFDKLFFILLTFIVTFSIFSQRVINVDDLIINKSLNYERAHDLETVFYSVSQVSVGKALLSDNFVNLYGLYPHFLSFLFKLTGGVNIFNFTFVMALISAASALLIIMFLKKIIENRLLIFIGICFYFIFYLMVAGYISPGFLNDPSFQYNPIRLFFPSLLIFLSSIYFKNKKQLFYYISFFISAFSILWNAETGIVVFLTWIIANCYNDLFSSSRQIWRAFLQHFLKGFLVLFLTFLFYILYVYSTTGKIPNFSLFLQYQSYYYLLGFNMLPMKLIHPWNIILIIYLIGIIYSIKKIFKKEHGFISSVVFLLTVLGVGVFSFYQGRSADFNLLAPIYPAILLLIIFADRIIVSIKSFGYKPIHNLVFLIILLFLLLSYFPYLKDNYREVILGNFENSKYIATNLFQPGKGQSVIRSEIEFIKDNLAENKKIIILSTFPGAYHAETNTESVFEGPGLMELFLKKDLNQYYETLRKNKKYKLFVTQIYHVGEYEFLNVEVEKIIKNNYRLISENKERTIRLYEPNK